MTKGKALVAYEAGKSLEGADLSGENLRETNLTCANLIWHSTVRKLLARAV